MVLLIVGAEESVVLVELPTGLARLTSHLTRD